MTEKQKTIFVSNGTSAGDLLFYSLMILGGLFFIIAEETRQNQALYGFGALLVGSIGFCYNLVIFAHDSGLISTKSKRSILIRSTKAQNAALSPLKLLVKPLAVFLRLSWKTVKWLLIIGVPVAAIISFFSMPPTTIIIVLLVVLILK